MAAVAAGIAVVAAVVLYRQVDPESSGLFPRCLFEWATGLKCPGCGSQRAIHQLLNGNVLKALQYNALVVAAIPYLSLGGALRLCKSRLYDKLYRGTAVQAALAVIVCFWVLRNVFGF